MHLSVNYGNEKELSATADEFADLIDLINAGVFLLWGDSARPVKTYE